MVMASKPTADPKKIKVIDATIQSELKLAVMTKQIDQADAIFLLVARLPEWGNRKFVMDMVKAAFDDADKKAK